jgi:hypothetical protein
MTEATDAKETPETTDARVAIRKAKSLLADLMEGEAYSQVGLEEVKYDHHKGIWVVTLGFNRSWDVEKEVGSGLSLGVYPTTVTRQRRTYKKLLLDGKSGDFIEMTD